MLFPDSSARKSAIERFTESFGRIAKSEPNGAIVIRPRQIYILPTRYGVLFTVMLFGMLVGSNNYGINMGFMLTFLLSGVGISTILHTWRNLSDLTITPGQVEPVFKGEVAKFGLILKSSETEPKSSVQVMMNGEAVVTDTVGSDGVALYGSKKADRRGYLYPDRFTVFTYFPLGLCRSWAYFKTQQRCLVYPAPAEDVIRIEYQANSELAGNRMTIDQDDFMGHRAYQEGEKLSLVDWKAVARKRGMLVKEFGSAQSDERLLDWDSLSGGDTELKLSLLCRGVLELTVKDVSYALRLPGELIDQGRGLTHRDRCLKALALFEIKEEKTEVNANKIE